MSIVVKKFGGSILTTPSRIKLIAQAIGQGRKSSEKTVVVISAMGEKTDQLILLANTISSQPDKREYNMLLSSGEQINTALLTMALIDLGYPAKSFLGWQAQIKTKISSSGITIESVDTDMILAELNKNVIVVVAGFQGVDEANNITTLGRGGSDLTAVVLAKYLHADRCEIYKDTGGIYNADPKLSRSPYLLPVISYDTMLSIEQSGAKVLQRESIQFAKEHDLILHIMDPETNVCGTIISNDSNVESNLERDDCDEINKIDVVDEAVEYVLLAKKYESNVRYYSECFPEVFSSAYGSNIYTRSGKRYLDYFSGAGALNYGHNNQKIKAAVTDYLMHDNIIHSLDMHTPPHIDALIKFQDIILQPRNLDYKIQFTGPTGADATEAALKLARTFTKRKNIIYFQNSYHGLSLGALSVSDLQHKRERIQVSFPDTIRFSYDHENLTESLLKEYDDYLSHLSSDQLPAAFIVESIQGEGGVKTASKAWLKGIERLAKKFSILMILDDIQTGCGRTGHFFSFETMDISPDIVCLSKSLSGFGLPLSMILLKPHLDIWEPGEHTGTFRSNNLSLVSMIEALNFWKNNDFSDQILRKAAIFNDKIDQIIAAYPDYAMRKNGRGLMLGIEWSVESVAKKVAQDVFHQGLIVETSGSHQQVLKLLPPLTITEEEIIEGMQLIKNSIKKVLSTK